MSSPSRMSDRRLAVLDEIAARVPYGDGVRVGIDGVDGAGKTVFADQLADRLRVTDREVVRVSADDFHHVRAIRWSRGRNSAEGYFLDSYDLVALRERVLDPLGPGGDRRYRTASHDLATDRPLDPPPRLAPPGAVLVLDGLFLHREELAACWELSVFLQVRFDVSVARMAARDGGSPDPGHPSTARHVQGQRRYLRTCVPQDRADLVVEHDEVDAPVLVVGPARGSKTGPSAVRGPVDPS